MVCVLVWCMFQVSNRHSGPSLLLHFLKHNSNYSWTLQKLVGFHCTSVLSSPLNFPCLSTFLLPSIAFALPSSHPAFIMDDSHQEKTRKAIYDASTSHKMHKTVFNIFVINVFNQSHSIMNLCIHSLIRSYTSCSGSSSCVWHITHKTHLTCFHIIWPQLQFHGFHPI